MYASETFTALLNTLAVAAGAISLAVPISLVLAVLLLRTDVVGRRVAWIALASQLALPLYAFVGAWSAGFGTLGWWPLAQSAALSWEFGSLLAVIFIHAVAAIPWCVLILSFGLLWTERSTEELALIEGGFAMLVRRVLFPSLLPWIACACLWTLVPVLTEMVVTNLYRVSTIAEQVYLDISLGTATWSTAVAAVLGSLIPLMTWAAIVYRQLPKLSSLADRLNHFSPTIVRLRQWRLVASGCVWFVVITLVAVPIGNLLHKAGWQTFVTPPNTISHQWSLSRLSLTIFETTTLFTDEFLWTAKLAVASATLALGFAVVLRVCASNSTARLTVTSLCLMLLALPGPIVGLLLTKLFLNSQLPILAWLYDHTLLAPVMAQQARLLPLAWMMTQLIVATIPTRVWELAALDGLGRFSKFRYCLWRATWPLWIVTWCMLAAVSAGELSTYLLLLPPGVTTLAQRIFELLHFGMRYQDSGLCMALLGIGWFVALITWKTRLQRN